MSTKIISDVNKSMKQPKQVKKRIRILTEEQRIKKTEYKRKWIANLSKEQIKKIAEYKRKYNANLSEVQRKKRAEYDHKRRTNMTVEKRKLRSEYQRKYYESQSEKRLKQKEEKRANLTDEERRKKCEYERKWYYNMSDEIREKYKERKRRYKQEKRKIKTLNMYTSNQYTPNNTNESNFIDINHECDNPLRDLIEQVIEKGLNIDASDILNKNVLRRILQIFGLNYPLDIFLVDEYTLQLINFDIDIDCLIELLKKWDGWNLYDLKFDSVNEAYKDMYDYIENNLIDVQRHKKIFILEQLNCLDDISEGIINVSCSLKRLHKIFSMKSVHLDQLAITEYVTNIPYISTRINLPDFSMTRQNINCDEFQLTNLSDGKGLKTDSCQKQTTNLFFHPSNGTDLFMSNFIIIFLKQLKCAIINKNATDMALARKRELLRAIDELESDIELCTNTIKTNTTYHVYLNKYPYVRYLGCPINEPVQNNNFIENVRLKQICRPKISFVLEKFNLNYEENDDNIYFIFDEQFLNKINTCIAYKCVLCDEDLGTYNPSLQIFEHLTNYHGGEPDWKCSNCNQSFATDYLSKHRWKHNC